MKYQAGASYSQRNLTSIEERSKHSNLVAKLAWIRGCEQGGYGRRCRWVREGNDHHEWEPDANVDPPPHRDRDKLNQGDDHHPDKESSPVLADSGATIGSDRIRQADERGQDNGNLEVREQLGAFRRPLKAFLSCHFLGSPVDLATS